MANKENLKWVDEILQTDCDRAVRVSIMYAGDEPIQVLVEENLYKVFPLTDELKAHADKYRGRGFSFDNQEEHEDYESGEDLDELPSESFYHGKRGYESTLYQADVDPYYVEELWEI